MVLAVAESLVLATDTPLARLGRTALAPVSGPAGPGLAASDGRLYFLILPLVGLATTAPVALLRGQRVAAGVVVFAACALSLAAFHTLTVAGAAAQLIVCYRLGRGGAQRLALALAVPYLVPALAFGAAEPGGGGPWSAVAPPAPGTPPGMAPEPAPSNGSGIRVLVLLLAAAAPAAALAGTARRARGEAMASSAERQVIADSLLEHTARGERARIARELHDVVAHHISMVAVQAETARLTTKGMPAAGAERLSAIGDTARAALTEMRRLLGVLREDTGQDTAARRPQPGLRLDELNDLLDESREAAGTATRLILHGRPVTLDPGVELAAYRIIQEALTNARRHAPGAAVDVELRYGHESLRVRVRDNGPGPGRPQRPEGGNGEGHG
ncbi:hypothetical protein HII36_55325, partial [Nonomuraea sp. NN258]|nr:hypothetical protein [Nonomuraea antri]